jgi:hypothetical protein
MSKKLDELVQGRVNRRSFLRAAAAAAVTAGAAGSATLSAAEKAPTEGSGSQAQDSDKGYRLTQHIADYYKSAAR